MMGAGLGGYIGGGCFKAAPLVIVGKVFYSHS
jgi:hypothetical protein